MTGLVPDGAPSADSAQWLLEMLQIYWLSTGDYPLWSYYPTYGKPLGWVQQL
jgi:hypothetical protein